MLCSDARAQERPAPRAVRTAAIAETWSYTIRSGDTLIGIGRAYLREPRAWPDIQRLNRVADPARLRIGSVLRIPLAMLRIFEGTADAVWTRGDVRAIETTGAVRPVTAGMTLRTGSRVETGADSGVRLRLIDGALVTVGERSQIDLRELIVFSFSGAAKTRLGVTRGRVENAVTPERPPESSYEIATPVVTTAVRGTEFRIGVADDGATARAEVVSGAIAASRSGTAGAPLGIGPGFGLAARAGEPLAAPRPLPAPPALTSVPARVERLPFRAGWAAAPDARSYRVQLAELPADRILIDAIVTGAELQVPDVADGRYALRVRSVDDSGLEGADASASLEVRARPEPPMASQPKLGGRSYGESAEFLWTRSDAAEAYDLQIASEPTFASPIVNLTGRTEVTWSQPLPPGSYYWRVASRTAALGRGPFSDTLSFTQRRTPAARDAQASLEAASLTLRWSSGPPGETSLFQLAADREFSRVLAERTLAESSVTLPRPEPGTYFLRVRAIDDEGMAGPFGPTQSITVPPPPPRRRAWWPWLIPPAVAGALIAILQ
jgi:hypothetical protein